MSDYDTMREVWFSLSVDKRLEFIQTNIIIPTTKGSLIPLTLTIEQQRWFLDGPLFEDYTKKTKFHNRILLKIRNVGASLVMVAAESVLCCWIYKGIFVPYISSGEDQANELIVHAKKIIENCNFKIMLKGELKDQTKFEINYENGSRIKSFASNNPRGIRGPRALMGYVDEMAFVKYPQEIMSAVEFMASEGGQINVLSTPFGKQNLFWQIFADKENFANYHRHRITLFDKMDTFDIKESLYDYVARTGAKLTCPWLSLDFLENKRKSDAPFQYVNFLEEAVGIPVEERTAIITESMLNAYTMDECLIEYRPLNDKGEKDMTEDFIISIDFGADVNVTAVTVFVCRNARLIPCYTEAFNGDFLEQLGKVRNIVKRFDPKFIIGDETGMGGKAQSLNSLLCTPHGWKRMGDIKIGDIINTIDGDLQSVIAIHPQGIKKMYEILFSDDSKTLVTEDHLWECWKTEEGPRTNKIRTTKEISKIIKGYNGVNIPLCKPVIKLGNVNNIKIDPYVLGVLLGDGGLTKQITLTTEDQYIIDKISNRIPTSMSIRKTGNLQYSIIGKGRINNITDNLRKYKLFPIKCENRFIPEVYMNSSIQYRTELIQGLMDTDGYVDARGHLSYTTKSKVLAENVKELVWSLGAKAIIKQTNKKCYNNGKIGIYYTVYFNSEHNADFVTLPRKYNRIPKKTRKKCGRKVISIKYIGEEPAQCISVEKKLYITNDYIVTHNSWMSILTNDIGDCAVIGVNYSKKDIALEYGVNMDNKSFFVTTAIRLITEGGMIVPKNHARLREELLGMQKIVYEKNIKYTGKDGPAKGDDLAMSFMQAALLYNRIYEIDGNEGTGFADVGIRMTREGSKERDTPRGQKAETFIEAAGSKKKYGEPETIRGFDKLI